MNYKLANFVELKELGNGKYGRVFKAKYLPNNKIFAIKEIKIQEDNPNQELAISREINTMNLMSNIKHPNIMEYFGYFIENNHYYLVLEYINGENLEITRDKYQSMKQYMNQDLIILILKGIINGLLYLHSRKILHRDISPDNIIIDKDNNIKITDFGISRLFDLNNPSDYNEWEGTIIGKKYYCSQEMYQEYILGKKHAKYDFKTDIYSLGVTMFNLMTFEFPYDIDKNIKIRNNNNIDPNIYNPDLINIVMSMLEPNKNKRPSCQEVYNELCNLIGKNNMDIYYNMKTEDINLEDNYISKRSAFFSVIYSLYNVAQIKSYFINDNVKKKVENQKEKSKESVVVIDSFIEIINNFKDKKNRLNNITKFIGNVSQKITIFKNYNIVYPKLIIDSLFNYFFINTNINFNNIFAYNNTTAYDLSDKIKDNKTICSFVKQKVEEFKNNYTDIFSDIFYFLKHKKITCPNCNTLIEENVDIIYDIKLFESGNIKKLLDEYSLEKSYSNLNKKKLICNKCFVMPTNFNETNSIVNSPNVLIVHIENDNSIDETIEIKEEISQNMIIKYILISVIIQEALNNNRNRYNVSIKNMGIDSWIYHKDDNSEVLSFEALQSKGKICTCFYKKMQGN